MSDAVPRPGAPVPPVTYRELEHIEERLEKGAERMRRIEESLTAQKRELDRNTELTQAIQTDTADIRELLAAARVGFKVLGGLGTLAKWAAPILAVLAALGLFHSQGGPK